MEGTSSRISRHIRRPFAHAIGGHGSSPRYISRSISVEGSAARTRRLGEPSLPRPKRTLQELRLMLQGAMHVHSKYSDGEFTLEELRDTFLSEGCTFVCMTDHAEYFDPASLQTYMQELH